MRDEKIPALTFELNSRDEPPGIIPKFNGCQPYNGESNRKDANLQHATSVGQARIRHESSDDPTKVQQRSNTNQAIIKQGCVNKSAANQQESNNGAR